MRKYRSITIFLYPVWAALTFLNAFLQGTLDYLVIVLSSLLALWTLVPILKKAEFQSRLAELFDRLFGISSALLLLGAVFRIFSWPEISIFGIGLIGIFISAILLFVPKVQDQYLPHMKLISLRIIALLSVAFLSFL